MLIRSRNVFPHGSIIVGNNGWNSGPTFSNLLNGAMIETFLAGAKHDKKKFGWGGIMNTYILFQTHSVTPNLFMIMANDDSEKNYRKMRFALASTLMFDGYFCFTNETSAYATTRWYDEYSVDLDSGKSVRALQQKGYLGKPISDAYNVDKPAELLKDKVSSSPEKAESKVWRRDFEHGVVIVNPDQQKHTIPLNGTFWKIRGKVDPKFNDGSSISEITLGSQEGAILLRSGHS